MKISNFGLGIAFLTLTVAPVGFAQPDAETQAMASRPKPPRVRATEPSKQITQDLRGFADAINTRDISPHSQRWIYGARIGYFGANEWARGSDLAEMRSIGVTMKIANLSVDKIEGETAVATVTYVFTAPDNWGGEGKALWTRKRTETLRLKLGALLPNQERIWQIVPPDAPPQNFQNSYFDKQLDNTWAKVSFVLAQKPNLKASNASAKLSMSRMKDLSLAMMQFLQDYDKRYAFAPEYLQEALSPYGYLEAKENFSLPDSQETYSFNANLSDKSFVDVKEPIKTVMFYEGADEKPTFRYDGQAAIAYADGHVRLVTLEEAKSLIWKP